MNHMQYGVKERCFWTERIHKFKHAWSRFGLPRNKKEREREKRKKLKGGRLEEEKSRTLG